MPENVELHIEAGFLAIGVPGGYHQKSGGKHQVRLSLVLSPYVSSNRELEPGEQTEQLYQDYWKQKAQILHDWPGLLFPEPGTLDRFKFRITDMGGQVIVPAKAVCVDFDDTHGGSAFPKIQKDGRDVPGEEKSAALALWNAMFGKSTETDGMWVEPQVIPPESPGEEEGSSVASAGSQQGLGRSLRGLNKQTVEGITSGEMGRLVALGTALQVAATASRNHKSPMAVSAVDDAASVTKPPLGKPPQGIAAPSLLPEGAKPSWRQALRRIDQVISRQDQLGSAGADSSTLIEEKNRPESTGVKDLEKEFHHRLSVLDDHPAIARLLRLVVDLILEIELPEGTREFLLVPEITLSSGSTSLVGLSRPTVCHLEETMEEKIFRAIPAQDTQLTDDGHCVNPEHLDSSQWDVEGGVRSVLRQNGFNSSGNPDDEGFGPLSSHGMTVFWQFADLGGSRFPWSDDQQTGKIADWLNTMKLEALEPSPSWEAYLETDSTAGKDEKVKSLKLVIPGRFEDRQKRDIWISGKLRLTVRGLADGDTGVIVATLGRGEPVFEWQKPGVALDLPRFKPFFAERIGKEGAGLRKYDARRKFLGAVERHLSNRTPLGTKIWQAPAVPAEPGAAAEGGIPDLDPLWVEASRLWADDLVLGYAPRVAVYKDAAAALEEKEFTGEWRDLTRRKLELEFRKEPLATTFPYKLSWEDDMALVHTTAEAPQPLAGWVVDILSVATDSDSNRIHFHYLVSTSSGFVVVKEEKDRIPPASEAAGTGDESEDIVTVRRGLLASVTSEQKRISLGEFCRFRGQWDKNLGCFVASEGNLVLGEGMAGRIQGAVSASLLRADETGPARGFVKISLAVKSAPYQLLNKGTAAGAETLTSSETTYVYLRGTSKPADQWNTQDEFSYFQGRGKAALVVVDDAASPVPAGSEPLRVPALPVQARYLGPGETDVHRFNLIDESTDSTRRERLQEIKIKFADGVKIVTMTKTAAAAGDLSVNSIYQISALPVLVGDKLEIRVTELMELSAGVSGTYVGMKKDDAGKWTASFILAGRSTVDCQVNEKTIVTFAPTGGEDGASWPASSQGKWLDMGMRLDSQTPCLLTLGPRDPETLKYPLARVDASWPAGTETFFAFVNGTPLQGRPFNVTRILPFQDSQDVLEKTFRLGADCEILSLPPVLPPVSPWRRQHHLPNGCLARFSAKDGVVHAAEVINSLQSPLVGLRKESVTLNLPGNTNTSHAFVMGRTQADLMGTWLEDMRYNEASKPEERANFPTWQTKALLAGDATVVSLKLVIPGSLEKRGEGENGWSDGTRWIPLKNSAGVPGIEVLRKAQELVFTIGEGPKVKVELTDDKDIPTGEFMVQVQKTFLAKDEAGSVVEHQVHTLIISGRGTGNAALQAGNYIPLFFEKTSSGGPAAAIDYTALVEAAKITGFPLAVDARHGLVIESADKNTADWEIVCAKKPENVPESSTPSVFGQNLAGLSRVEVGADKTSYHWKEHYPVSILDSSTWAKGEPLPSDNQPQYFQMVFHGGALLKWPLKEGYTIEKGEMTTGEPAIPKNDQVIADDVLFHWNGWSLAAEPDHRVKARRMREFQPGAKNTEQPPLIPVEATSVGNLPQQRVGTGMRIHVRVVDLAGNSRKVPTPTIKQSLLFRPFGRVSQGASKGEPPSSFLRFAPLGAPVAWLSDGKVNAVPAAPPKGNKGGKGTTGNPGSNNRGGSAGNNGSAAAATVDSTSEIVLATDRAGLLPDGAGLKDKDPLKELIAMVTSREVRISLLPPPVSWTLAQTLGCFDGDKAKGSYRRITLGEDWGNAPPWLKRKEDAKPEDWSPLTDSVADPHVKGFLVRSQAADRDLVLSENNPSKTIREGSIRLDAAVAPVGKPVPVTDLFLAKPLPDAGTPVPGPSPFNLPGSEPGPLPRFDKTGNRLGFSEDSDVTLRIHAAFSHKAPKDNKVPAAVEKDYHYPTHYLQAFTRWASAVVEQTDGNNERFNTLVRAMLLLARDGEDPFQPQDAVFHDLITRLGSLFEKGVAGPEFLLHPWVSTPRLLRVRHVTNQPYQAPKLLKMELLPRMPGSTDASFSSTFEIHRPSTGYVTLQAALEENYSDDPRSDAPSVPPEEMLLIYENPAHRKIALEALDKQLIEFDHAEHGDGRERGVPLTEVKVLGRTKDLTTVLLRPPLDLSLIMPDYPEATHPFNGGSEENVNFRQEFDDTRHRTVFYRGVAHSRHGKQFFTEQYSETNPRTVHAYGHNDEWARVELPATVPPADLNVSDISVVFEWSEGGWKDQLWWTSGDGSWEFNRSRRAGHRLWIERPWYSSGSGEKLAVLLWMTTPRNWEAGQEYAHLVSRWGADPVFETELPSDRQERGDRDIPGLLTREDFIRPWSTPMGLRARQIQPLRGEEDASLPGEADATSVQPGEKPTDPSVTLPVGLATYTPRYHPERKQWYVDIFAEPRSYCPFVTYTVARYQPCSLPECALSVPRRLRMLQILPTRTVSITATCKGHIELKVTLSGIFPPQNHRRIAVAIQKNPFLEDATDATSEQDADFNGFELGWEPVAVMGPDGSSVPEVVYYDPEPALHPNGDGAGHQDVPATCVTLTVRLQRLPLHVSRLKQRDQHSRNDPAKVSGNCRYLRVSITEDEIHPYAHAMPEDLREGPRRIFAEQVLLPRELLETGRLAVEETQEERERKQMENGKKELQRAVGNAGAGEAPPTKNKTKQSAPPVRTPGSGNPIP